MNILLVIVLVLVCLAAVVVIARLISVSIADRNYAKNRPKRLRTEAEVTAIKKAIDKLPRLGAAQRRLDNVEVENPLSPPQAKDGALYLPIIDWMMKEKNGEAGTLNFAKERMRRNDAELTAWLVANFRWFDKESKDRILQGVSPQTALAIGQRMERQSRSDT